MYRAAKTPSGAPTTLLSTEGHTVWVVKRDPARPHAVTDHGHVGELWRSKSRDPGISVSVMGRRTYYQSQMGSTVMMHDTGESYTPIVATTPANNAGGATPPAAEPVEPRGVPAWKLQQDPKLRALLRDGLSRNCGGYGS